MNRDPLFLSEELSALFSQRRLMIAGLPFLLFFLII